MNLRIEDRVAAIKEVGQSSKFHKTTVNRLVSEYRDAMRGRSRKLAIKCFCSECMGFDPPLANAIRSCTDTGCPLYPYRPYQ